MVGLKILMIVVEVNHPRVTSEESRQGKDCEIFGRKHSSHIDWYILLSSFKNLEFQQQPELKIYLSVLKVTGKDK